MSILRVYDFSTFKTTIGLEEYFGLYIKSQVKDYKVENGFFIPDNNSVKFTCYDNGIIHEDIYISLKFKITDLTVDGRLDIFSLDLSDLNNKGYYINLYLDKNHNIASHIYDEKGKDTGILPITDNKNFNPNSIHTLQIKINLDNSFTLPWRLFSGTVRLDGKEYGTHYIGQAGKVKKNKKKKEQQKIKLIDINFIYTTSMKFKQIITNDDEGDPVTSGWLNDVIIRRSEYSNIETKDKINYIEEALISQPKYGRYTLDYNYAIAENYASIVPDYTRIDAADRTLLESRYLHCVSFLHYNNPNEIMLFGFWDVDNINNCDYGLFLLNGNLTFKLVDKDNTIHEIWTITDQELREKYIDPDLDFQYIFIWIGFYDKAKVLYIYINHNERQIRHIYSFSFKERRGRGKFILHYNKDNIYDNLSRVCAFAYIIRGLYVHRIYNFPYDYEYIKYFESYFIELDTLTKDNKFNDYANSIYDDYQEKWVLSNNKYSKREFQHYRENNDDNDNPENILNVLLSNNVHSFINIPSKPNERIKKQFNFEVKSDQDVERTTYIPLIRLQKTDDGGSNNINLYGTDAQGQRFDLITIRNFVNQNFQLFDRKKRQVFDRKKRQADIETYNISYVFGKELNNEKLSSMSNKLTAYFSTRK